MWFTRDLKAAAMFREFADDAAKRVFNRAFQRHYDLPALPPLSFLDPHQLVGVKWALSRSRSYLAHAPGAGKTIEAIVITCLAQDFILRPSLYILPPGLVENWRREITRFLRALGFHKDGILVQTLPLSAHKEDMNWNADIILMPDSMLAKGWVVSKLESIKSFSTLIVDEASRFKEPTTIRSRILYGGVIGEKRHPGLFQKARHTVFLDGSPLLNRPMELWAPTFALHPEAIDCMNQQDFGFRYCGATLNKMGQWEFKHSSRESELREKLQRDFMHVVTESELEHPERRRSMVFMGGDYKSWERKNITTDAVSEDLSRGVLATQRKEIGVAKMPWAVRYVGDRLESGSEQILLFCWHREVAEELKQRLSRFKPALVIGGTSPHIRERAFKEFQEGRLRLIIGNIQAMGRGHNLQAASRVVFAEFSWTDENNRQCEKRASRRGSEKDFVRCEYLVAPGTLDERVLNAIFTKEKRVKQVIG
jgi:SNF2 family DNA or RNA helicase